jgi:hypothetical protein
MSQRLLMPLLASLTLGLAPFQPEPHLVGKLRWLSGGAVGMGATDWFDLVMHGAPWIWLLVELVRATLAWRTAAKTRPEA